MGRRLLHTGEYAPVKCSTGYVPETWAMANMNMIIHERAEYGRQIIATLSQQLSWSHFMELLPLEQPLRRDFYAEMCRVERWTVRTLRDRIDSMLFERTAISKKPDELAKAEIAALRAEDQISPSMVFKDPYLLDFLGLNDRYLEKDLEDAILLEIETFLLELGNGFAFLGRQSGGLSQKAARDFTPQ